MQTRLINLQNIKIVLFKLLLLWENPLGAFLCSLVIYVLLVLARGPIWSVSKFSYYNYLADAFLHGQLHLRLTPITIHDLVVYDHKLYLYWAPMPAVILMPFIAIFGVGFSDVLFTAVVGAVNVGLVAILLRQAALRGVARVSQVQRALLVVVFALGSVHFPMAPLGRVWFTGQFLAFLFTVLAYYIPMKMKGGMAFLLTGVVITCAMLTRSHLILIGFWPAYYLLSEHRKEGWKKLVSYSTLGILPIILGLVAFGAYNWLRFGNVTEMGLDYHLMGEFFRKDYEQYGVFHRHYLPINFYYQYIAYPFPVRVETLIGGSLFLLTPVFFAAFWGLLKGRPRLSSLFLGLSILLVDIPILFLMGTGYLQFGPRYTLDFTAPLLLLTALGIRRWNIKIVTLLAGISVLHYLIGCLLLVMIVI